MKKYVKIIIFILLIVVFLVNSVYAADTSDDTYTPSFKPDALNPNFENTDDITEVGNGLLSVVSLIGSGIAIIAIIALGIKYMMGSVEERASYKKTLLPYFIGAIFVFGASTVAGIVYNMFN